MSRSRTLALFAFVVFAFFVVAVRSEINARAIKDSGREIARTQYDQCAARNEVIGRQNGLLDAAIAAEKRRPTPDSQRIRDLIQFKDDILDCGRRP
jgi:CHASE3 domain sensor protein